MNRRVVVWFLMLLLTADYCLLSTPLHAQGSNGTYTLVQDVLSSAGGRIGGGNPMQAQTVLGLPASGMASNCTYTLLGGLSIVRAAQTAPTTVNVTVAGTIDDAAATVTLNGIPAMVTGSAFTADVPLVLGPNVITAVATDTLGNRASVSVTVYVDLSPEDKTPRFSITVAGDAANRSEERRVGKECR